MSKFIAGHVTKTWFLTYELPLSENKMLHLNFKENVEKDDVVTFTAHLNPNVNFTHVLKYARKNYATVEISPKGQYIALPDIETEGKHLY